MALLLTTATARSASLQLAHNVSLELKRPHPYEHGSLNGLYLRYNGNTP